MHESFSSAFAYRSFVISKFFRKLAEIFALKDRLPESATPAMKLPNVHDTAHTT
jgi:hypothetical protein